jgi:glucokinase
MKESSTHRERANCVLVYDVGGSHVSAAFCDMDTYRLGPIANAPHPAEQTCDAFLHLLHSLGDAACNGYDGVLGAQLAVPGPFDLAAGVSRMRHKLPYLYGVDLRSALAERFGWLPDQVRFVNDADAFLLGEIGAGAARTETRAVGITLGTGVGSAFAVNGRVVTEGSGVPSRGEIWSLPYESSTVEDFVSARAIRRGYERRRSQSRNVVELAMIAGEDKAARECFIEFGYHLGRALHSVLSTFAPDIVVLGGGISRSAHLFLPTAQRELDGLNAPLLISTLLDHAPLVGAGVAWFAELTL